MVILKGKSEEKKEGKFMNGAKNKGKI